MLYRLPLLLTFIGVPLLAHNTSQDLFEKANGLYRKQKYKKALSTYRQIPEKGWSVLYNMGNCAYRLNKKGEALANWRRAEKHASMLGVSEISDNIELLTTKMYGKQKDSPARFVRKVWRVCKNLARSVPIGYTQVLLLLFLFLYGFLLVNTTQLSHFSFSAPLIGLNTLLGLFLIFQLYVGMQSIGIVVSSKADVRSGPNKGFQVLSTVSEAQEIRILGSSHDYFKVRSGSVSGWVEVKNVKKI